MKLEVWEEELDQNGQPVLFGSSLDARIDAGNKKVKFLTINISGCQYETIKINAFGRKAPAGTRLDTMSGLRILVAGGLQYVVIDSPSNFRDGLNKAMNPGANAPVYDHGKSSYGVHLGL